ncbi:MAG: polymerase [Treponema sp.]|jgi:hypothetical protein|nr:polymerase [Treponema sp.]
MRKIFFSLQILLLSAAWAEPALGITGAVNWEKMTIEAQVSLDLASAGIRLPTGRSQGEELIRAGYSGLIRPRILSLPVDSSRTVADYVRSGDLSLSRVEAFAWKAQLRPPAHSADLSSLNAAYRLNLADLAAEFLSHTRPAEPPRIIAPPPSADHTGILIIAGEELPLHGTGRSAIPLPCLFPKIWDTDMNLVYEKNMLEVPDGKTPAPHYTGRAKIFLPSPSGLSPEVSEVVGERPLRILARGVFGIRPTDPVIHRDDAVLILSSENNRRLLREGRVMIVLDDRALEDPFNLDREKNPGIR